LLYIRKLIIIIFLLNLADSRIQKLISSSNEIPSIRQVTIGSS